MKRIKVPECIADKLVRRHSDFRLEFFRGSGPGGQARNKRDTAARITDKITGLSAEAQDATGQLDNKVSAFYKLVDKLISHYKKEMVKEIAVGPERTIRTYKIKNDLVIDHRINKKYSFEEILSGKLEELHNDLLELLNEKI